MSKNLAILQTVIDETNRKDPAKADRKWTLFDLLVSKATAKGCHVLLLPAGFWSVRSPQEVDPLVNKVHDAAQKARITIVGGVDVQAGKKVEVADKGKEKKDDKHAETPAIQGFPYYCFSVNCDQGEVRIWQQRSTRNSNATRKNAVDMKKRIVIIQGRRVLVLACGEVHGRFNQRGVQEQSIHLVLNPAHTGAKGQVLKGIRAIARRAEAPGLRADHRSGTKGSFQRARKDGTSDSKPLLAGILIQEGTPWAYGTVFSM